MLLLLLKEGALSAGHFRKAAPQRLTVTGQFHRRNRPYSAVLNMEVDFEFFQLFFLEMVGNLLVQWDGFLFLFVDSFGLLEDEFSSREV